MEQITVRIYRFIPGVDEHPYWQSYQVPRMPQMTVLDALFAIQNEQDDSLSFRCSCRVGMCGSCGMTINGRPRLACRTAVDEVGDRIEVTPMRNMPVVKDLVVDMAPFFAKYEKVLPYLVPRDPDAPPAVVPPDSRERGIIDDNLECITCGLCYAGCGVVSMDPSYLGPAALNRAYTLIQDPRDAAAAERLAIVDSHEGIWRCHTQMACTDNCPKHLSPTHTIQQLRGKVVSRKLLKSLRWWSQDE